VELAITALVLLYMYMYVCVYVLIVVGRIIHMMWLKSLVPR